MYTITHFTLLRYLHGLKVLTETTLIIFISLKPDKALYHFYTTLYLFTVPPPQLDVS